MTTTAAPTSKKRSKETSSYDAGVLARQNREPLDSAPGSPDEPLNMEWRRGWMAIRTGECQTPNLLDEIVQAGFRAESDQLEALNEGQRIEILDWLDTAPVGSDELSEDDWEKFNERAPKFISIEEAANGMLTQIRIVEVAPTTDEQPATSEESVPPTPGETAPETSPPIPDELQTKFTRQAEHLQEIEEANQKVKELNSLVVECEAEVKAAKGRLSEAQSERDAAVRVLSQIIDDSKSGQGKLFPAAEIAAANGVGLKSTLTTAVGEVPIRDGDVAPEQHYPTLADSFTPLSVLSAKQIKQLVGADAFNAAKDSIEGPVGLSDKQLEKLEAACESDTLQGLEKWIAGDSWWHDKIPGFGEAAISKVTSTIMAYRRVHPQVG